MLVSLILATFCPTLDRYELCERSFSELHSTGLDRDQYELIVVNNGGLHQPLLEELDLDLLITCDRNIGQGAGLNIGASIARSKNLFFIDDDLSYTENWLKVGMTLLNRHSESVISLREYGLKWATPYKGNHISPRAGGVWLMRRSLFRSIGPFSMTHYCFGGLWTRNMTRRGVRFIISETPYILHLGRGQSIIGPNKEFIRTYRRKT